MIEAAGGRVEMPPRRNLSQIKRANEEGKGRELGRDRKENIKIPSDLRMLTLFQTLHTSS